MRIYYTYLFCVLCVVLTAQQTPQFTQFTFNKSGYNPAASGSNINAGYEIISGTRQQWVGFEGAPKTSFFSANYTFKPERSYKRWHNAGLYVSQDIMGLFSTTSIHGSYTLHLPVLKQYVLSFGIYAGIKQFGFGKTAIDKNDPVYTKSSQLFLAYPDFIPGIRFKNRKFIIDVSLFHAYKFRRAQGDKQIGNKSLLVPQLYASYTRKIMLENQVAIVPSVNIHSGFTSIPSAELNVMVYFAKRVGIGSTIRNINSLSGILQVRFAKNITIGVAYDYTLSKLTNTAPHTYEIMLGITPLFQELLDGKPRNSIAKCPVLDF